ncbi:hypothetical protein ACYSNR_11130 [Enterococcus sp. LJL128]|uniref:hypothetical protein n=1 Tax=Enterococcus sp. LJL51 TaxID=3416656 RepID=UPI003CF80A47
MNLKEKITDAAEKVYDLTKQKKYNVKVGVSSKITSNRNTTHNKKWRAKNN